MARMTNGSRTQDRTQRRMDRRDERGGDRGAERGTREYKEIYGVVDRGENSFWTRIGAAFVNSDGSMNLLFNFTPTDPQTTIQPFLASCPGMRAARVDQSTARRK